MAAHSCLVSHQPSDWLISLKCGRGAPPRLPVPSALDAALISISRGAFFPLPPSFPRLSASPVPPSLSLFPFRPHPPTPRAWLLVVGAPLTAALTVSALVMVNVVAHLLLLVEKKARQAVVSLSPTVSLKVAVTLCLFEQVV